MAKKCNIPTSALLLWLKRGGVEENFQLQMWIHIWEFQYTWFAIATKRGNLEGIPTEKYG